MGPRAIPIISVDMVRTRLGRCGGRSGQTVFAGRSVLDHQFFDGIQQVRHVVSM